MKAEWKDTRDDGFVVWDLNDDDDDLFFLDGEKPSTEASSSKKQAKQDKQGKQTKQTKENEESHWQKEVLSWVMTFVIAIGAALILKNFVIINATVPTGSMENTIMPDDNLFGFRLAYLNSQPERGDIIIFKFPDNETERYVKRVIGLPGEKITITEGKVYINDSPEPLAEDYLKEEWIRAIGPYEFEIPDGSYFVMGDNRNNSFDSRYWQHTFVTDDEIIGEAIFVYYPFNHFGKLD